MPDKNRIVKTAQWFIYPEPDGSVGDRLINFYRAIAQGGPGQITVEESICDYPLGASNVLHIRLDHDRFIPGLSRLAAAIHEYGVPAVVQITHAGPAHSPNQPDGGQPIAPSSIDPPSEPTFAVARELTHTEVQALVEKFAQAARRCKDAGFDGVELHCAHYALVNAFLSRRQNKRTDEYGCQSLFTFAWAVCIVSTCCSSISRSNVASTPSRVTKESGRASLHPRGHPRRRPGGSGSIDETDLQRQDGTAWTVPFVFLLHIRCIL